MLVAARWAVPSDPGTYPGDDEVEGLGVTEVPSRGYNPKNVSRQEYTSRSHDQKVVAADDLLQQRPSPASLP